MKRFIAASTAAALFGAAAYADDIKVTVNGAYIAFDQPPVIDNDRTLVPMRAIFETLGAEVEWDGENKMITSTKGETKIVMTIDSNIMTVDDDKIELDVPAKIINDRTMVPVRAVSEALKCEVEWDGELRMVIIKDDAKAEETALPSSAPEATSAPEASPEPTAKPLPSPIPAAITDGENIFDPEWLLEKSEIDAKTGNVKENEKMIATDFIGINAGKSYYAGYYDPNNLKFVGGYCINYAFYDANKEYISGAAADMAKPVKAPEGASFIRFTIKLSDINGRAVKYLTFMQTDTAPEQFVKAKAITAKAETELFKDKKIFIVGDRQIQNASVWTNIVDERLGANVMTVKGYDYITYTVNDYRSLSINTTLQAFPKDADYMIVSSGFWEWMNNTGIGGEYSNSGGIYDFISNAKIKWPNTKLIIMTLPNAKYAGLGFTEAGRYNSNGADTAYYSELIREACEKNDVPVIDINALWGFSELDRYMKQSNLDYLYPNKEGGKLIADAVLKVLVELEK